MADPRVTDLIDLALIDPDALGDDPLGRTIKDIVATTPGANAVSGWASALPDDPREDGDE